MLSGSTVEGLCKSASDRTLKKFILAQINSGLALVHTAMAFREDSETRVRHRLLAEYRYKRVVWFLSRVDLSAESHTDVLDALAHLEHALGICRAEAAESARRAGSADLAPSLPQEDFAAAPSGRSAPERSSRRVDASRRPSRRR
jgi:hypothetical protein